MAKRKKSAPDMFAILAERIADYRDAAVAESWKGGGDPIDVPELEMRLKLAELVLTNHIEKIRREFN